MPWSCQPLCSLNTLLCAKHCANTQRNAFCVTPSRNSVSIKLKRKTQVISECLSTQKSKTHTIISPEISCAKQNSACLALFVTDNISLRSYWLFKSTLSPLHFLPPNYFSRGLAFLVYTRKLKFSGSPKPRLPLVGKSNWQIEMSLNHFPALSSRCPSPPHIMRNSFCPNIVWISNTQFPWGWPDEKRNLVCNIRPLFGSCIERTPKLNFYWAPWNDGHIKEAQLLPHCGMLKLF